MAKHIKHILSKQSLPELELAKAKPERIGLERRFDVVTTRLLKEQFKPKEKMFHY